MKSIIAQMSRGLCVVEPTIHIDRNLENDYPDWAKEHPPEIKLKGPADYTLADLEWFPHPKQVLGTSKGWEIYKDLLDTGELPWCLGFQDARGIQKSVNNVAELLKYTTGKAVVCWSAALKYGEKTDVACLGVEKGEVVIFWRDLDGDFDSSYVTPKFPQRFRTMG